jgi:hypothetical protein
MIAQGNRLVKSRLSKKSGGQAHNLSRRLNKGTVRAIPVLGPFLKIICTSAAVEL